MQLLNGIGLIQEANEQSLVEGSEVSICACVHKIRQMSEFAFVILRTGRDLIQCIYEPSACSKDLQLIKAGYYIKLVGTVRRLHQVEVLIKDFEVLSAPKEQYPLNVSARKLECSLETNLDNRSVALRNPNERAIFKLQEGMVSGFRDFMLQNDFTQIFSPKIVATGAEGGANIFNLKYFEKEVFLTQSPQFYKQTGVAFFDRVFEIGAVYRAERHNTTRHLNEYIGLDFEMGFINSMYDIMNMETAMLKYVFEHINEHYSKELKLLNADIPKIDTIPCLTFLETMDILGKKRSKFDLDPIDEVKICEYAKEKYDSDFVFITHFPASKRPFYAMNDKENNNLALSFDLLFRGLEITTGGQRIHDYDEQVAKMEEMGLNPEHFETYLEIHKYGMPPHGGLGIGLERLLMKTLNFDNIRKTSMFPRDINRILP